MADAWGRRFLKHLDAGVDAAGGAGREVARRSRESAGAIVEGRPKAEIDSRGRAIDGLCSYVLAGYREALAELDDPDLAISVVRGAFAATYRAPTRFAFRAWLRLVRDPLTMFARLPVAKLCRGMYGRTMTFEQEVGPDRVELIVTRCAYHRFFVEAGEPALTLAFCGWDRSWMDAIDLSSRPIRTERPSTLSTGGDCCRFRFVRGETRSSGPALDVVAR